MNKTYTMQVEITDEQLKQIKQLKEFAEENNLTVKDIREFLYHWGKIKDIVNKMN